jgi:hypothetical protein
MSNAYTNMAKELRELRVKCMGESNTKGTSSTSTSTSTSLPIVDDMKKVSAVLQGLADKF